MSVESSEKEYKNLKEFYPFYLGEHQNTICRVLHFFGTLGAIAGILTSIYLDIWWIALAGVAFGYANAWIGHFVFENNRPATFKYPLLSFLSDLILFSEFLTGKRAFVSNGKEKIVNQS
jgi:hypothetical protein